MKYDSRLLKKLNLSGKASANKEADSHGEITDMMNDPRYLRQSSALINDALQKGFDVLQLADGDIITTGTKTVVYQYTWDTEKGKLVKTRAESSGAKKPRRAHESDEDEDERENEEA